MTNQTCTRCHEQKPRDEAYFRRDTRVTFLRFRKQCRECESTRALNYYHTFNPRGYEDVNRHPELKWNRRSYNTFKELSQWLSRSSRPVASHSSSRK